MLLYVIRHGDPIYSPDTLTDKGREQAKALAKRLAVHGLDRIYCSPMGRARETAAPTCELLGIEPVIEEWTSEALAWRDLAGKMPNGRTEWIFHQPATTYKTPEILALGYEWYDAQPFCNVNSREGYRRICDASDEFTARLGYVREGCVYRAVESNDERVAVFCHQGFGTTWLSHLLAVPAPLFWSSFDITHSSITILNFATDPNGMSAPMCITLSDTSHIYADGLPLQFCNRIDI